MHNAMKQYWNFHTTLVAFVAFMAGCLLSGNTRVLHLTWRDAALIALIVVVSTIWRQFRRKPTWNDTVNETLNDLCESGKLYPTPPAADASADAWATYNRQVAAFYLRQSQQPK